MQLHVWVYFFLRGGMRRPGPATILSLCSVGKEEPGSAPVTQLLTALVLSFGLTSSTCLQILSLHCSLSALWNVFSEASPAKYTARVSLSKTQLVNSFMFLMQWHDILRRCFAVYAWFSWPAFLRSFEPTLRGFWGNAFLCFIGNRCRGELFFSLSWTFWSV